MTYLLETVIHKYMQPNYQQIIDEFNKAWNENRPHDVLNFFADNGFIENLPPPPHNQQNHWEGKDQMLGFIQAQIQGFHVNPSPIKVDGGNKVIWNFEASSDIFRSLGVEPSKGVAQAVFEGDKIRSFTITFSPETVATMAAKMTNAPSTI